MDESREGLIEARPGGVRRRSGNVFVAFLAASVAAHAGVIGWSPDTTRQAGPPQPDGLQVVILDPLPLPAAPKEPGLHSRSSSRSVLQRPPAAVEPEPGATVPEQAAADPEPRMLERRPVASGVEVPDPAAAPSSGHDSRAAPVAAAPASFSAAYLSNPSPRYPDTARRAGEQGTVVLRVQIARDGAASRVAVEQSSGSPHLDAAALEAVKAWRFTPARRGANAVESWMLVPIVFRLEGVS
jgi:protein TonB